MTSNNQYWHRGWAATALLVTAGLLAAASIRPGAAAPNPSAARVDYNRDVNPILANNCFQCHGLDTNKRYGGLRLDRADGAYKTLPSGRAAIVPGKPATSELVERITATGALRMPPVSSGKKLTAAQIETLRRWIAAGAVYADHWAYARIVRPIPPSGPGDPRSRGNWARAAGPIDRFLLARLDREGIRPSPEADRRTLIRRVSLDLTGLPPAARDVEAFVRDARPDAYARLVDRLLASPHYGERMAEYWLDMVRYADTVGYHGDQDVSVGPYRDYVIRAFNSDKPFDVFTREQLAGDLLPNAGPEQRVASGYNRLGMMSAEGGVQDKEYRAKYAAERVRNAAGVWLGATMGCSECHDHKYDPYTQKDFYSFEAFFADLKEQGYYGGGDYRGDWGPSMKLPTREQAATLARLESQIAASRSASAAIVDAALASGRAAWEQRIRGLDAAHELAWQPVKPVRPTSSGGSTVEIEPDGVVWVSGKAPAFDTYNVTLPADRDTVTGVKVDVLGDDRLAGNGIARSGHYYVLSEVDAAVQRGAGPAEPVQLASVTVGSDDEGYPGYALIDGRSDTGWATVYSHASDHRAVVRFARPVRGGPGVTIVVRLHHDSKPHLTIGKFRILLSSVPEPSLDDQGLPDNVLAALRKDPGARTAAESQAIATYYRTVAPELAETRQRLARLEGERSILLGRIPQTLVSEATEPRVIRVLPRGNWMVDTGEIVQPAVPHFLRQIAAKGRATRLDLANWLVAPDNPLTARVFVNRMWKLFFGTGIAKNLDDFGAQGEPPVHPELLDWLASEFMAGSDSAIHGTAGPDPHGASPVIRHLSFVPPPSSPGSQRYAPWSVKHVIRLIVTSAAYRQSSVASTETLARDPENRLCARQSPIRLDAEFVRDVALSACGLLSSRIGGPSVYPYEPSGYLAPLNFPRRDWAASVNEDQYRRGVYTQWQRTFVHPSLLAFDAPTREEFACTRSISNTPIQALVLMNDPTFVEAGRAFAARILRQGGATFEARLDFAFDTALSRRPGPREVAILRRLYVQQRARYAADPAAAGALLREGDSPAPTGDSVELAAWSAVARAILNLHETITRS